MQVLIDDEPEQEHILKNHILEYVKLNLYRRSFERPLLTISLEMHWQSKVLLAVRSPPVVVYVGLKHGILE